MRTFEYYLIDYFPNIFRNDSIIIGIVLFGGETAHVCFLSDWCSVQNVCPNADLELLKGLAAQIEKAGNAARALLESLADASNAIQVSEPKLLSAESAKVAMEELAAEHLK